MSGIGAFLAMGGYAAFVWPAYGIALAVLGGLAGHSWRRYRESVVALDRLQQNRRSRR
jgi:heme exporter protein D